MVNRILAIVNEDVITEADVASQAQALLEDQADAEVDEGAAAQMHDAALQHLIEQRLILQEAKRSLITIGSDEVMGRLNEIRSRFGSEEAFRQSLVDSGLSKELLKEKIREQLMVQELIQRAVRSTLRVSPQEVARALAAHPELAKSGDRVRISHILIRVDARRSAQQARALIEDLAQQLRDEPDFATVAKRSSEDSYRDEGGAMGWVAPGELLPELDAALAHLNVGERSDPIQTRLGFHLVKVEERRNATSLTVMEANHAVYQRLYQEKFREAFTRWLNELKRNAYIEILD